MAFRRIVPAGGGTFSQPDIAMPDTAAVQSADDLLEHIEHSLAREYIQLLDRCARGVLLRVQVNGEPYYRHRDDVIEHKDTIG